MSKWIAQEFQKRVTSLNLQLLCKVYDFLISVRMKIFSENLLKKLKKSWKFKNCEHPVQFPTSISTQKSCVYLSGIHSDQYQYKIIYESQVMTILVKMWIYLHLKIQMSWNFPNHIFYPLPIWWPNFSVLPLRGKMSNN